MTSRAAFTILALLLAATAAVAQETETKEQKVRRLLSLMNTGEIGIQMIDSMIPTLKASMPTVEEEFWPAFRKEINAGELVDLLVPVYARHLEEADIDELIRFFSSPAGARFLKTQPLILQESMAVGRQWGEKIAQRAIEALQKRKLQFIPRADAGSSVPPEDGGPLSPHVQRPSLHAARRNR